jgi:crotonobetainyl-CoA:carnitine CoA-transferase CaiB-like acyl-CoA transferase
MHLADQGAEVIKIEDPGRGDYARLDMAVGVSMSHIFHAINRGKKSVILDLREDEGREALLSLVDTADVLVESFRPGVMDRLGIGHETLRKRKPSLIVCAMTAYGQSGPLRDEPAHDNNMLALTGIADQFPRVDGHAVSPNYQIADVAGGSLTALSAIAMALFRRERTGEGATLDISLAEGALASAVLPFSTRQLHGHTPAAGEDMLTGALPCYGYYQTKDDRQMACGALEIKFWLAFCEAAGRSDLASKGHLMGDDGKAAKEEVAALFRKKTRDEWTELLKGTECCVTPVLSLDEAMEAPHLTERGILYEAEDPVDGKMPRLASPVVVDGERAKPLAPAPRHGEHDDEVLTRR